MESVSSMRMGASSSTKSHRGATSSGGSNNSGPVPIEAARPREMNELKSQPQAGDTAPMPAPSSSGSRRLRIVLPLAGLVLLALAAGGYFWLSKPRGMPFVVSYEPGRLISGGYSGWVGMEFTVGATPVTVTDLGRLVLAGNGRNHTLQLLQASTSQQIPGASIEISMKGHNAGEFAFAPLPKPVHLRAGETYLLVSSESVSNNVGDYFYDESSRVDTTAGLHVLHAVYLDGKTWRRLGRDNESFGPVNLKYFAQPQVK